MGLRCAIPVILDCDPGHDDAIALLLALASPELDVLAVTTVARQPDAREDHGERDPRARPRGRADLPVAAGADRPRTRALAVADHVHGESGLDGPALAAPSRTALAGAALDLQARMIASSDLPVTLVATGPLTNVARCSSAPAARTWSGSS